MAESLEALLALANTQPTAEDLAGVLPAGSDAPLAARATEAEVPAQTEPPAPTNPPADLTDSEQPAAADAPVYTEEDFAVLRDFAVEIGWDGELPGDIEPSVDGFAALYKARDAQRQAEVAAYADPEFVAYAEHRRQGGSWETFRQKLEAAQPVAVAEDDITAQENLVLTDLKAKGVDDDVAQTTVEALRDSGKLLAKAQAVAAANQQARLQNAQQATAAELQARQEEAARQEAFINAQVAAIAANNFDGHQMAPAALARYKAALQPDASGTPEIDVIWNSLTPAENCRLEAFAIELFEARRKAPAPAAPRPSARPASSLVGRSGKAEGTGDTLGDLNSLAHQMRQQDRQNATNTR